MTQHELHLGRVSTVIVPVTDQDAALAFYVDTLGMRKVSDFTYPSGERWLEVSPLEGSSNLCLIAERPERPAGIETGVVLFSGDLLTDLHRKRRPAPAGNARSAVAVSAARAAVRCRRR